MDDFFSPDLYDPILDDSVYPSLTEPYFWDDFDSPKLKVHDPRKLPIRNIDAKDTIVTSRVGEPAVSFQVHRSLLLRSSEFLQTKAKPEWLKAQAVVDLPHHPSVAFDIYSRWLYSGSIVSRSSSKSSLTGTAEDSEWRSLAYAFVLGEELMDLEFNDIIIDALRAKAHGEGSSSFWPVASDVVRILYDGSPQGSPARMFLVDIYHYHGDSTALDFEDGFPADFLLELSRASLSRRTNTLMSKPGPSETQKCVYHGHREDGKCYLDAKS